MKLPLIFCILFLILASCAPAHDVEEFDPITPSEYCNGKPEPCVVAKYTILIDNTLSQSKRQAVYNAAAEWGIRTGDTLDLRFQVLPPALLYDDSHHYRVISVFQHYPGDGYLGWCVWGVGAKIYMLDSLDDSYFQSVIKHELGHAFNLDHYEGSNSSIMHPAIGSGDDISCQDLTDFCAQWHCESNVTCNPNEITIETVTIKSYNFSEPEPNSCALR